MLPPRNREDDHAVLIAGNANPTLAAHIAKAYGETLADATVGRFSDGEIRVEINQNLRGRHVFLIQPTCPPVNDNLMELLVMADACRRASACSVTAVVPYFGYARQERKSSSRSPITAKLVADMMVSAGVDRLLSLDLHAPQIQGFFNTPVDNLYAMPLIAADIQSKHDDLSNTVIVSPDVGGVRRARALAKELDCPIAIIDKRRDNPNESAVLHVIGDVKGKNCILLDDMVDTAGTLVNAANALVEKHGAAQISAYATHGVLSGPAVERISNSKLAEVVLTDTIRHELPETCKNIRFIHAAPLLAEAMHRIITGESLSALFTAPPAKALKQDS
tara:strand:+ start:487054 stop:488055 length:1002 start_codon:yes stop_codon:yes gene_type:complete